MEIKKQVLYSHSPKINHLGLVNFQGNFNQKHKQL